MAILEKLLWPPLALVVAPLASLDLVWIPALKNSDYIIARSYEEVLELRKSGTHRPIVLLLHWQAFTKVSKKLAKLNWDIVIIDESQGLKSRTSEQSKAARRLRHAKRRIALSGTPIDDSPIDVWAQIRFVNHTIFGDNWLDFAEEYCYKTGFMNKEWRFNPRKMDQFLEVLKPHIYRLTVGFLKLKPMLIHPVPVHILGEQLRIYNQMKKGVVQVGRVEITAELEGTIRFKLAQVTGGAILDNEDIPRRTGYAKERKLRTLISKLKPPFAIFCHHRHEIPIIAAVIKEKYPRVKAMHGGVSRKDNTRTQLVNDFQAGKLDALICQVRTGGVAIDLTRSHNLIVYSMNHSYIDFEQMIFRLYGMNQKNQLDIWLLYAADTIDQEKIEVIEDKESTTYKIVSHFEGVKE